MIKKELTIKAIKKELNVLAEKYTSYRAFFQEKQGLIITANPQHTVAEPVPYSKGLVISIIRNHINFEASGSVHSQSDIKKIVQKLIHNIENNFVLKKDESNEANFDVLNEDKITQDFFSRQGEDFSLEKKLKMAESIMKKILSRDKSVTMSQVRYKHIRTKEFYISPQKSLSQNISRFEAIFIAILKDEKTQQTAQIYDGYASQGAWELMTPDEEMLDKMILDGKKILSAKRMEPGFYDCIFSPALSGILAHEAFGHGTEADTMAKDRAKGSQYINKYVASTEVSLYDSPEKDYAASYFFDNEGMLSSTTKIIENGKLLNPMTDFLSAQKLNLKRTANGRRENYSHKIYTRMSNTFFKAGSDNVDEMIQSIQDGFFVDRATNGMEDPKAWGIQLEALYAERIKNGKLTGDVFSPVIITGYVPDILKSISMISDKIHINGLGMCGKGYKEWVKVTDGGPYLKLKARLA